MSVDDVLKDTGSGSHSDLSAPEAAVLSTELHWPVVRVI